MSSLNLYEASNQWANRPADERFWGLHDLSKFLREEKELTKEMTVGVKNIEAVNDKGSIGLVGPKKEKPAQLTNWAFGQLCRVLDAPPASSLAKYPAELVTPLLNHSIEKFGKDDTCKLLFRQNGSLLTRAITSEGYGRYWNLELLDTIRPATDLGWMVPPARPNNDNGRARRATKEDIVPNQDDFGLCVKVGDMIAPAGVYCSDRDMFVFLVNPKRVIDDGGKGLMRGVFMWNSEVGKGAFKMKSFYLENVCGNHIVWGASKIKELRVIHKEGSIKDLGKKVATMLRDWAAISSTNEEGAIRAARNFVIAPTKEAVIEKLFENKKLDLSKKDITAAYEWAEMWERTAMSPPNTAWGFIHGLTRYSQTMPYAEERDKLDQAAGKYLDMVLAA